MRPFSRLTAGAERIAHRLEELTGHETRSLVLGHLQRGGEPIAFDRILSLRFGAAAVKLAEQGHFGCMVAFDPPHMKPVPLAEAVSKLKTAPPDHELIRSGRAMGISFGD